MSDQREFKDIEKIEELRLTWGKKQRLKELTNRYLKWLATNSKNDRLATGADILLRYRETYGINITS